MAKVKSLKTKVKDAASFEAASFVCSPIVETQQNFAILIRLYFS